MSDITPPAGPQGSVGPVSSVNGQVGNAVVTDIDTDQTAIYDAGNSTATKTIDWNNGKYQKLTLTDDVTLTFTPPTGKVGRLTLETIQDATGGWTITYASTVKGPAGVAAQPTATIAAHDVIDYQFDGTKYDSSVRIADSH